GLGPSAAGPRGGGGGPRGGRGPPGGARRRAPRGAAHLGLRASAHDDRGGSVTQEIIRAAGVR
ncbi:hypothetical protein, partial [Streptomyces sp. NPDC017086]|uniref:hypothetical protein n=1 Tax=Streptomyces sp. NPDC017086 TaxID=3364976 RepID=UPI0037942B1E